MPDALQARLEHAAAVGEQQRVVEEEERAKMAVLAEQMSNEEAQREGEVRRRHEAAMAKLALDRERQVSLPLLKASCMSEHLFAKEVLSICTANLCIIHALS